MAAFPPGHPKPPNSGRKKGVGNKSPPIRTIRDGLAAHSFDITDELLSLYNHTSDATMRFKILNLLASYTQPSVPKEEPQAPPSLSLEDSLPSDSNSLLEIVKS